MQHEIFFFTNNRLFRVRLCVWSCEETKKNIKVFSDFPPLSRCVCKCFSLLRQKIRTNTGKLSAAASLPISLTTFFSDIKIILFETTRMHGRNYCNFLSGSIAITTLFCSIFHEPHTVSTREKIWQFGCNEKRVASVETTVNLKHLRVGRMLKTIWR